MGSALRNILMTNSNIGKDQATVLFERCIDVISQLKFINNSLASNTLNRIFVILRQIVKNNYVTKKYFQEKFALSTCLDAFKNLDNTWNVRDEILTASATRFFSSCRYKHL